MQFFQRRFFIFISNALMTDKAINKRPIKPTAIWLGFLPSPFANISGRCWQIGYHLHTPVVAVHKFDC